MNTYNDMQDLNEKAASLSSIPIVLDYSSLERIWGLAKVYNSRQNIYIKDGYINDTVRVFEFLHNERLPIFAHMKITRIQYAALLISEDLFLSLKDAKNIAKL